MSKVTITAKEDGFAPWIKMGLEFIGSGEFYNKENVFELNINPLKFGLLSELVRLWAKSYCDEFKKLNPNAKRPRPASLYKIEA